MTAGALKSGDKLVLSPRCQAGRRHGHGGRQVTGRRWRNALRPPLIRIRGLSKAYQRGEQDIPVLLGIDLDVMRRRVRRADGPQRLGQEHAAEPDRRHRPAQRRHASRSAASTSPAGEGELADWRAATSASSSSSTT
jgi:hypothetical protein